MGRKRQLTEEEKKAVQRTEDAAQLIGAGTITALDQVEGYNYTPPSEAPPPAPEDQPLPGEGTAYQTEDKKDAIEILKDPEARAAAQQGLSRLQQERLGQELEGGPPGLGQALGKPTPQASPAPRPEYDAPPMDLQTEFGEGGTLQRVKPPDGSFQGTDLLYMLAPAVATAIAAARAATAKGGSRTKEKQWSDFYGAVGQLGQGVGQALDAGARREASDTNRFTSEMANRSRGQRMALDKAQGAAQLGLDREKEAARAAEAAAAQEAAAAEAKAKQEQKGVEWSHQVASEPSVEADSPRSVAAFENTMALLEGNKNPQLQAQVDAVKAKLGERAGQVSQADIENDSGLQQLLQSITHPPKPGKARGTGGGAKPPTGPNWQSQRDWWVDFEAKDYVERTYGETWETASEEQKASALNVMNHVVPGEEKAFRQWQVDSSKKLTRGAETPEEAQARVAKVNEVKLFKRKSYEAADAIEKSIDAFDAKHGEGAFTAALQQIGGIEALLGEGGLTGLVNRGRFAFADFSIDELNAAAQPLRDVAMELRNKKFGASLTKGEKEAWEKFAGDEGLYAFQGGPRYLVQKLRRGADLVDDMWRKTAPKAYVASATTERLAENLGVTPRKKTQEEDDASVLDDLANEGFQVDPQ